MILDIAAMLDQIAEGFSDNSELQDLLGITALGKGLCPRPYLAPDVVLVDNSAVGNALMKRALIGLEDEYLPELEIQHEVEVVAGLKELLQIVNRQSLLSLLVENKEAAESLGFDLPTLRQYASICSAGFMHTLAERSQEILRLGHQMDAENEKIGELFKDWT